jgi:hypothetical protein
MVILADGNPWVTVQERSSLSVNLNKFLDLLLQLSGFGPRKRRMDSEPIQGVFQTYTGRRWKAWEYRGWVEEELLGEMEDPFEAVKWQQVPPLHSSPRRGEERDLASSQRSLKNLRVCCSTNFGLYVGGFLSIRGGVHEKRKNRRQRSECLVGKVYRAAFALKYNFFHYCGRPAW